MVQTLEDMALAVSIKIQNAEALKAEPMSKFDELPEIKEYLGEGQLGIYRLDAEPPMLVLPDTPNPNLFESYLLAYKASQDNIKYHLLQVEPCTASVSFGQGHVDMVSGKRFYFDGLKIDIDVAGAGAVNFDAEHNPQGIVDFLYEFASRTLGLDNIIPSTPLTGQYLGRVSGLPSFG